MRIPLCCIRFPSLPGTCSLLCVRVCVFVPFILPSLCTFSAHYTFSVAPHFAVIMALSDGPAVVTQEGGKKNIFSLSFELKDASPLVYTPVRYSASFSGSPLLGARASFALKKGHIVPAALLSSFWSLLLRARIAGLKS